MHPVRRLIPTGTMLPFAGAVPPPGQWLPCEGQAVSRTTYARLFGQIATLYGAGDGSTTFNVPDMRGRFPLGVAVSGTGSALGGTGGALDHTHAPGSLATASAGDHTHSVTIPPSPVPVLAGNKEVGMDGVVDTGSAGAHTHTISGGSSDDTSTPFTGPDASTSTATAFGGGIGSTTAVNQNATAVNQNAGPAAAASAHANLQPYIVVYMWKRTA